MIQLKKVSKVYGKGENEFSALSGIDLKIPSGGKIAIVGKSGSGKSTLMHIMSGLEKPSKGYVIIDGQDLAELKDKQVDGFRANKMGFIFQAFFIEPKQTCYYNVSLPLEIKGVAPAKRNNLINSALESVGLLEKTKVAAGNLSGGQKQRLAIARAIVNKPKYIFADEPTGNLDSTNGKKVIDLLFDLNHKLGSTICLVTHDEDIAARCDEQIVISDGRIDGSKKKAVRR